MSAKALDHRGQVLVPLRHTAQSGLVADDVWIAEAHLQRDVLVFQGGQSFEHRPSRLRRQPTGTTGIGSTSRLETSLCTGKASRARPTKRVRPPGAPRASLPPRT